MSWNYRVVRRELEDEEIYAIHEVYYDESGRANWITVEPCWVQGDSLDELKGDFELYRKAFDSPVLDYSAFVDTDRLTYSHD